MYRTNESVGVTCKTRMLQQWCRFPLI